MLRRLDSNQRPSGYEPDELPLLHAAEFSIPHRARHRAGARGAGSALRVTASAASWGWELGVGDGVGVGVGTGVGGSKVGAVAGTPAKLGVALPPGSRTYTFSPGIT